MDEWEQGLLLIALYVVCVGGGYLYEWIKKIKTRRKKAQAVVDKINHEIAVETMEQEVAESKTAETVVDDNTTSTPTETVEEHNQTTEE